MPDSCCISYREHCGKSDHPSNIPYTGCIYRFIDDTRDHLNILGAIGFGLCFIQLFGLILSCCLYFKWFVTKKKKQQETDEIQLLTKPKCSSHHTPTAISSILQSFNICRLCCKFLRELFTFYNFCFIYCVPYLMWNILEIYWTHK